MSQVLNPLEDNAILNLIGIKPVGVGFRTSSFTRVRRDLLGPRLARAAFPLPYKPPNIRYAELCNCYLLSIPNIGRVVLEVPYFTRLVEVLLSVLVLGE